MRRRLNSRGQPCSIWPTAIAYMPSGSAYMEFVSIMNRLYPQVKTYIALVEGFPSLDDILPHIIV